MNFSLSQTTSNSNYLLTYLLTLDALHVPPSSLVMCRLPPEVHDGWNTVVLD
jgi:hypothetical protein